MSRDHALAYFNARDSLAADVRLGLVKGGVSPNGLFDHIIDRAGVDPNTAAELTERFLGDLKRHGEMRRRRRQSAET